MSVGKVGQQWRDGREGEAGFGGRSADMRDLEKQKKLSLPPRVLAGTNRSLSPLNHWLYG